VHLIAGSLTHTHSLSLSISLFLSFSLSLSHIHINVYICTHTHTHTQVDALRTYFQSLDGDEDEEQELPEEQGGEGAASDGGGGDAGGGDAEEGAGQGSACSMTGRQLWELQWASAEIEVEGGGKGVYYANKYTYESSWTPPVEPVYDDEEAALVAQRTR
jgi:hypothetical protein